MLVKLRKMMGPNKFLEGEADSCVGELQSPLDETLISIPCIYEKCAIGTVCIL